MSAKRIITGGFFFCLASLLTSSMTGEAQASCNPSARTCFTPKTQYTDWKFVRVKNGATPDNCIAIYKRFKRFYSNGWQNLEEYKQERCKSSQFNTPNQTGVRTTPWRFSNFKPNSTPESCTAIYVRDFRYYQPGGYRTSQQKREGECSQGAVQELVKKRERKIKRQKEQIFQACANYIKKDPKPSYYTDEIVAKVCPASVKIGRLDKGLYEKERLKSIKRFNAEQKIRDQEKARKIATRKRELKANMDFASERARQINKSSKTQKAFASQYVYGNSDAFLEIAEISSMVPGKTLGMQNIVDLNIKTQVNRGPLGENRARVFCAEGRHSYIVGGVLEGSSYGPGVSDRLARWACKRHGFYYP